MTDNSKSYNQTHKAWFSRHAYKTKQLFYLSQRTSSRNVCTVCFWIILFCICICFYRPNPAVGYHMPNKRVVFVDVVVHDTWNILPTKTYSTWARRLWAGCNEYPAKAGRVNQHIAWYTSPYPWTCSVRWCLAEGLACEDQRRRAGSGSALEACSRRCTNLRLF